MLALESKDIQCPYCWQIITIGIDCSVSQQEYVEDCQICCRPILMTVSILEDEDIDVYARAENE